MDTTKILVMAVSVLLPIVSNLNWTRTKIRYSVKKVIDCFVPVWSYASLLFIRYQEITVGSDSRLISFIFGVVLIITYAIFFILEYGTFSKVNDQVAKNLPFALIIVNLFIVLLMLFSIMNYTLYILAPNQYQLPEGLSFKAIGFEFVYYTFSLMITYSGASIEAIGVVTKFCQMLEVIACYICVGICLVRLIDKIKS